MSTTTHQRVMLGKRMDLLVRNAPKIHYKERRPMATRGIHNVVELLIALSRPEGLTMDCSETVTLLCKLAGLRDPNGQNYNGTGFTGTLLANLPHYTNPRTAQVGALVVFGPGRGEHVAMVREPGIDPILFSHGQEAGPLWVRLSIEKAAHDAPVTFLSIADLG